MATKPSFKTTPDALFEHPLPPSPGKIGIRPISEYAFLERRGAEIRGRYGEQTIVIIRKNIESLINGKDKVYFLSDTNPFVAIKKSNGQVWWKAVYACVKREVKEVGDYVLGKSLSLHINTGTHGDEHGNTIADHFLLGDGRFVKEDIESFWDPTGGLSGLHQSLLIDIHFMSGEKPLPEYPSRANHIIDAWCYSVQTLYTSLSMHEHCLDRNGDYIPSHLKCPISGDLIEDPVRFQECLVLKGRTHFYDRNSIEFLIEQKAAILNDLHPTVTFGMLGMQSIGEAFKRMDTEQLSRELKSRDISVVSRCRLAECAQDIPNLRRPIDDGPPIESIKKEIAVFKREKAKRQSERKRSEEERRLAIMHRAQVGTLLHPLTLAGEAVPPRFFQTLIGNILATTPAPSSTSSSAVVVPSQIQLQQACQVLAYIDPTTIQNGIRADFSHTETSVLDEMLNRLEALKHITHNSASAIFRAAEEASKAEDSVLAIRRSEECGLLIDGLPKLDAIYYALQAFVQERKLQEEKAISSQQADELQAKDLRLERVSGFVRQKEQVIDQQAEAIEAQAAKIKKLEIAMKEDPSILAALEARIELMQLDAEVSTQFQAQLRRDILEETSVKLSLYFRGLLEDGAVYSATSFLESYRMSREDPVKIEGVIKELLDIPGINDQICVKSWELLTGEMPSLGPRQNYADIYPASGKKAPPLMLREMRAILETKAYEGVVIELNRRHLALTIPKDLEGKTAWDTEETSRRNPKTFKEKLVQIVAPVLAKIWIEENNTKLEAFFPNIAQSTCKIYRKQHFYFLA